MERGKKYPPKFVAADGGRDRSPRNFPDRSGGEAGIARNRYSEEQIARALERMEQALRDWGARQPRTEAYDEQSTELRR